MNHFYTTMILVFVLTAGFSVQSQADCKGSLAIQVLGSGGPIADDSRASSGYLLWLDGRARLLVDAGGGVFLRFGEAKAGFNDLDAIVLTHLHTDHAGDLPALLKTGFFTDRKHPLDVAGPTGSTGWPRTSEFIHGMFNKETGVFRYLDGLLDGSGGLYELRTKDINAGSKEPVVVAEAGDYRVTAVGVHHGPVPALGLIIEVRDKRIALSGDQNDDNPAFAGLVKNADLLLMDHAIPQDADSVARNLHATPKYIGELAAGAGIKHLVLTHLMARSLNKLEQNKALIRENYTGPLSVAQDLDCYYP